MSSPTDLMELRHDLHRHPEIGFDVKRTAAIVAQQLRAAGMVVTEGIGHTGVVGVLPGSTNDTIGLRADMDALPIQELGDHPHRSQVAGAFHGCGHDGHPAMLIGAACRLANASAAQRPNVVFVFQPDEESGGGAQAMIDDDLIDRFGITAMFGLHNHPGREVGVFATRPGPMMASEDRFTISVTGSGGHSSQAGRLADPGPVAAEIMMAIPGLIDRTAIDDARVISVTSMSDDGSWNVVPSTVTLIGDIRTFTRSARQAMIDSLANLAHASATEAVATKLEIESAFVPLTNTYQETEVALAAASQTGETVDSSLVEPWCASEDFARFLEHVPGCYMTVGNGLSGACGSVLHHPHYDFNDALLEIGATYWTNLVSEFAQRAA